MRAGDSWDILLLSVRSSVHLSMADKRNKPDFGLDGAFIERMNWKRANTRIQNDVQTDFIFAPHLSSIYSHSEEALLEEVQGKLRGGRFAPQVPITIEVPKSAQMRVAKGRRSDGPNFSRPGSIPLPHDRLLYQALADEAAAIVESATDRTRSFAHQLSPAGSPEMFQANRKCWSAMQSRLSSLLDDEANRFVLKIDVANCFSSVNQHTLIKALHSTGYPSELGAVLENMLVRFTNDRSSRGIIQGVYPSDLFGDFYLTAIDQFLGDIQLPSVRYVDDIYILLPTARAAHRTLREVTDKLRSYDLMLNEAKSYVTTAKALNNDEPDLDKMFNQAIAEYREFLLDNQEVRSYGFQAVWHPKSAAVASEESHEVEGLEVLFSSIPDYRESAEQIERFCLPLLGSAGSDYAVNYVLEHFVEKPSMSQFYCAYLNRFIEVDDEITERLSALLESDRITFDWQRMWILAALSNSGALSDATLKKAQQLAQSGNSHEALRAAAMPVVAKLGSYNRRKSLVDSYATLGSPYLQSALLYSSRYFPPVERRNAMSAWSAHNQLNRLIATALPALVSSQ